MSRLSILDYLQRGVVYSCVALSVYGVAMGISAHRHIVHKGREFMEKRETAARIQQQEELNEKTLAEAAQEAFSKSR